MSNLASHQGSKIWEAIERSEMKNEKLYHVVGSRIEDLIELFPSHSNQIMEIESLFHEINIRSQELAYQEGYKQGLSKRSWFKQIFHSRQKILTK